VFLKRSKHLGWASNRPFPREPGLSPAAVRRLCCTIH
jgi:hypothetical protein